MGTGMAYNLLSGFTDICKDREYTSKVRMSTSIK